MTGLVTLLLSAWISIPGLALAGTSMLWDFDQAGETQGWVLPDAAHRQNLSPLEVQDGSLLTEVTGRNPSMSVLFVEPVEASDFGYFRMRYRISSLDREAQLMWGTEIYPRPGTSGQWRNFAIEADGEWHEAELDLTRIGTWRGRIVELRVDPVRLGSPGDSVEIDSMELTQLSVPAPAEVLTWEFNEDGNVQGWKPGSALSPLECADGILKTEILEYNPRLYSAPGLQINAGALTTFWMRYRTNSGADTARLLWQTLHAPWIGGRNQRMQFPIVGDGSWQELVLDLSDHRAWAGMVTRLRLDLSANAGSGFLEIDAVRLLPRGYDTALNEPAWEFETDLGGWEAWGSLAPLQVVEGALVSEITHYDPRMGVPATLMMSASVYPYLELRYRLEDTDGLGQLMWARADSPAVGQQNKYLNFPTLPDSTWHTTTVNAGSSSEWKGLITQVRLDPARVNGSGRVEFDFIRFVPEVNPDLDELPPSVEILYPLDGVRGLQGDIPVQIKADDSLTGATGIESVEVSIIPGIWEPAAPNPDKDCFEFFWKRPSDGHYQLLARATDNAGHTQEMQVPAQVEVAPLARKGARGLYVWHVWEQTEGISYIADPQWRRDLLSFAQEKGITRLLLGSYGVVYGNDKDRQDYREFIAAAHALGIEVYGLQGEHFWSVPQSEAPEGEVYSEQGWEYAEAIVAFGEFDGILDDTEPYIANNADWESRTELRAQWHLDYLKGVVQRAGSLPVNVTIPFWYDQSSGTWDLKLDGSAEGRPFNEYISDVVDEVNVMAYRDFALGANGSFEHSQGEMAYAPCWVSVEIQDMEALNEPYADLQSYWEEGEAYMEGELGVFYDEAQEYSDFKENLRGFSIHYERPYRELKP
ncbi:MAG: hypothetical protein JW937_04120 [Candidatus Omnitrophica bacterium]|nr:hypothetical protein [Candidatus Omnitrophota bacterium]